MISVKLGRMATINIFFPNRFDCFTVFKKVKIQYLYHSFMDHVWWSFMVKSWCYKNCFIWCWVTELYSGKSSWYQQSTDLVCSFNNIHKNKESLTWPCFMAIHGQHVFPWPCLTVKHGQDIFSIFFYFCQIGQDGNPLISSSLIVLIA